MSTRVPLASRAMEVLTEVRRLADDSGLIFPSTTGRRGRHFLLYRISSKTEPLLIDVLRVLHDRMDLPSAGAK